jgi:hypothetical protein
MTCCHHSKILHFIVAYSEAFVNQIQQKMFLIGRKFMRFDGTTKRTGCVMQPVPGQLFDRD